MLVIERIGFRTLKCLLYAAYIVGHTTASEGKTLTHPDSVAERKGLTLLLAKEAEL